LIKAFSPCRSLQVSNTINSIEESSIRAAFEEAKDCMGLIHLSDSNRLGLGSGHISFQHLLPVIQEAFPQVPIILEIALKGMTPQKNKLSKRDEHTVLTEVKRSIDYFTNKKKEGHYAA